MTEKIKAFIGHLFDTAPGPSFDFYIPVLILSGVLIAVGIAVGIIYSRRKKYDFAFKRLFKNLSRTLILIGLLFLILTAIRYENIPYFSTPILNYLSVLLLLFVIYKTVKKYFVDYKRESENIKNMRVAKSQKQTASRYLPNKGK